MLNKLSNIAQSMLSHTTKPKPVIETKPEDDKISFTLPNTRVITPFILDYVKSDNWHTVRDFINTWLIRYQVANNNKLHSSVANDKSIGVVANLSGKVTAADEFRLFLLGLEKNVIRELELMNKGDK